MSGYIHPKIGKRAFYRFIIFYLTRFVRLLNQGPKPAVAVTHVYLCIWSFGQLCQSKPASRIWPENQLFLKRFRKRERRQRVPAQSDVRNAVSAFVRFPPRSVVFFRSPRIGTDLGARFPMACDSDRVRIRSSSAAFLSRSREALSSHCARLSHRRPRRNGRGRVIG